MATRKSMLAYAGLAALLPAGPANAANDENLIGGPAGRDLIGLRPSAPSVSARSRIETAPAALSALGDFRSVSSSPSTAGPRAPVGSSP